MKSREKLDQSEAVLILAEQRVKAWDIWLTWAPLSVSHSATRAVNLHFFRSPRLENKMHLLKLVKSLNTVWGKWGKQLKFAYTASIFFVATLKSGCVLEALVLLSCWMIPSTFSIVLVMSLILSVGSFQFTERKTLQTSGRFRKRKKTTQSNETVIRAINAILAATWWTGFCYLNKREWNLNQSKYGSFVERVAKNNSWNNGDSHKMHAISLFIFLFSL